jgi:anti-anti-sigma regulatory factor
VCAVRAHGSVDSVPPAGSADHLCWIYENDADFDAAARAFLTGGLERGERLLCVGERVIESLGTMTPPVPDLAGVMARGAVETLTLDEVYASGGSLDPARQLAYYGAATRRARDAGYRGLRVLAEASDLAADPALRPQLVRWEQLADEFAVHGGGFTAMCAYRVDLPREALADVAAVHPLVRGPREVSSFRLFSDRDRLRLIGSVDTFCSDRLARVLDAAPVAENGVVLDLAGLDFLDIAACRTLARWAARLAARSVRLEVTGSSALLRRMWQLLDLDRVAPVTFGDQHT